MAAAIGKTENLADMENLTNETLLRELKARFNANTIYTYVGEILVTVNPFKWIDGVYGDMIQAAYTNMGDKKSKAPHIYAMADAAYQAMVSTNKGQCCVISGESGAGKTEAAKLFVKQILKVSNGSEFAGLEEKLIQLNPLLEAFGNAQTLMNDNSSRFGKFTSLIFNKSGSIKGAVMKEYLLEKSRVVWQAEGEQNFHIFYLFFAGLDTAGRDLYEVNDPAAHRYLSSNPTALKNIKSQKMAEMRKELVDCIKTVGFTDTQQENLFHLLSGVLHLGDLEFEGEDEARIVSAGTLLSQVCNQLGIDEELLENAMTKMTLIINGEATEKKYKKLQAEDCRDATAKALYDKAFTWIMEECNKLLGPPDAGKSDGDVAMGVLDIFGFECFANNSFEQLCINLTNEQLQFFFNEHIFAMELEEYKKEGITGKDITYQNNQPLLDMLLLSKPLGLFGILNEESNFPKATDSTMVVKFHAAFDKHKDYVRPRGNEDAFSLKHYAGEVKYNGFGFLEKNRDTLPVDVLGAMRISENALVQLLFEGDAAAADAKKPAPKGRAKLDRQASRSRMRQSIKLAQKAEAKKVKSTVAQRFKDSLEALMRQLTASSPHFVRCVKPNLAKKADQFDDALVTKQLTYTGMLETTRIRKEGYASRPLFGDFVHRYKILGFECRAQIAPTGDACRAILTKAGITGFEVGHTKVFLRYFHVDQLNEKLKPYNGAAALISKYARGIAARVGYERRLAAKREQDRRVEAIFTAMERAATGAREVFHALVEEDAKRPADYWVKAAAPPPPEPKGVNDASNSAKVKRAASVKWFKEVEKKKGNGMANGKFAKWFHGIITRQESEDLLRSKPSGTFLIRVAESRFGYSLSLIFKGRCKHFMIDQDKQGRYIVVGNDRTFPSLNDIVAYHEKQQVTDEGDCLVHPCEGLGDRADLKELM